MSGAGPARSQRADSPARGGRGLLAGWKLPWSQPPGTRVLRLPGPVIVWWAWMIFLVANLVNLALSGRDWNSVVVVVVLALITGLVYALGFRPRVITDQNGITVRNPFRDHWMPWGAVESIVVGESVQMHCSPAPGADRKKVVHSWALYASRQSRIRHGERRGRRSVFQTPPSVNTKLPKEAQEMMKQSAVEHIAAEIDLQARMAKQRGAPEGAWSGSWPWLPIAAVLIPAVALAIVLIIR
jgi:Bacterial PH domain